MKTSYTPGDWMVKHSESKPAFNVIGTVLGGKYKIARCPYVILNGNGDATIFLNEREKKEAEYNATLIAAAPTLLQEMQRYLPILEWVESMPEIWARATRGTGIATINGYKNAIEKATNQQP